MGWYEDAAINMKCQPMFILCGQKSDLENLRQVTKMEAEALAQNLGIPYVETSALQGVNVEDAFKILAEAVYEQMRAGAFRNVNDFDMNFFINIE